MNRGQAGFTLIEVLVVCMLMSFITITVVSGISAGLRVWSQLNESENNRQWTQLAFHQIRADIRNARRFELLPYQGSYKEFVFPTLVSSELESGNTIKELGRVAYYRDSKYDRLCRSETPFRLTEKERFRSECQEVLGGVSRIKFSYLLGDVESDTRKWVSRWKEDFPPLAVRMDVDLETEDGETAREQFLVSIPIAMGAMLGNASAL